jgi:hypothetical protein
MSKEPPSCLTRVPGGPMKSNLFDLLCEELGYDRSTVLVIRVDPREASVSYTELSGMPRSTVHRFRRELDIARNTENVA